jgi:hypothetical protein
MLIVVGLVLAQDPLQTGLVLDKGAVQKACGGIPDPALGDRVDAGARTLHSRVYWYIQADENLREAQVEELPSGWAYSGPVETHDYVKPDDYGSGRPDARDTELSGLASSSIARRMGEAPCAGHRQPGVHDGSVKCWPAG